MNRRALPIYMHFFFLYLSTWKSESVSNKISKRNAIRYIYMCAVFQENFYLLIEDLRNDFFWNNNKVHWKGFVL